jgi:cell pole-organizing protein PopZ
MGDVSAEPSMEDILSSIKRIIAEEGDAAVSARTVRKPVRPGGPVSRSDEDDFGHGEILELSDPVRAANPVAAEIPAAEIRVAEPQAQPAAAESILSPQATQASRGPLEALSRMVIKPEAPGSDTLEGMVREMIRPMLREWLDSYLPAMVETMVAREIARITGQPR